MYFFHSLELPFSCVGDEGSCRLEFTCNKSPADGTPVVVLDRGRGLDELWWLFRSGVVGEGGEGDWSLGERLGVELTVW